MEISHTPTSPVLGIPKFLHLVKLREGLKPAVKTLCFHCKGTGSTPGQGTKMLHAAHRGLINEAEGEID